MRLVGLKAIRRLQSYKYQVALGHDAEKCLQALKFCGNYTDYYIGFNDLDDIEVFERKWTNTLTLQSLGGLCNFPRNIQKVIKSIAGCTMYGWESAAS